MAKLGILAGLGVGYVLGTRAGRERYDQLKQMAQQVMRDPRVKKQAAHAQSVVSEKATQAAGYVQDAVKEQVHGMAGKGATGPTSGNGSSAGTGTSSAGSTPTGPTSGR